MVDRQSVVLQLLARLKELMKSAPDPKSYADDSPESLAWRKEVVAVISAWNPTRGRLTAGEIRNFNHRAFGDGAYRNVMATLKQAQAELKAEAEK